MNGTVIFKFFGVLKYKKILGEICFSEQIFYRKQSSGAPDITNNHRSIYVRSTKSWWQVRGEVVVRIGVLDCSIGGQSIKKNLLGLPANSPGALWRRGPYQRESQVARRLCKISRLFYVYSEER